MKNFYIEKIGKILKNKNKLESKLKVKLSMRGRNIEVKGKEIDEFIASRIIKALDMGFDLEIALLLKNEEFVEEEMDIKNFTKRHNLGQIRARIIGKEGRTLELISELSECYIKLHENIVSIIGQPDKIKIARNAIKKIIQGSKQSSVYTYLEKSRNKPELEDLGLKNKF